MLLQYKKYWTNITDKEYLKKCEKLLLCGCESKVITRFSKQVMFKERKKELTYNYVKEINPDFLFLTELGKKIFERNNDIGYRHGFDVIEIL